MQDANINFQRRSVCGKKIHQCKRKRKVSTGKGTHRLLLGNLLGWLLVRRWEGRRLLVRRRQRVDGVCWVGCHINHSATRRKTKQLSVPLPDDNAQHTLQKLHQSHVIVKMVSSPTPQAHKHTSLQAFSEARHILSQPFLDAINIFSRKLTLPVHLQGHPSCHVLLHAFSPHACNGKAAAVSAILFQSAKQKKNIAHLAFQKHEHAPSARSVVLIVLPPTGTLSITIPPPAPTASATTPSAPISV